MTTTLGPTSRIRTLLGAVLLSPASIGTIRGKRDGSKGRRYPALQPVPFAWL